MYLSYGLCLIVDLFLRNFLKMEWNVVAFDGINIIKLTVSSMAN